MFTSNNSTRDTQRIRVINQKPLGRISGRKRNASNGIVIYTTQPGLLHVTYGMVSPHAFLFKTEKKLAE